MDMEELVKKNNKMREYIKIITNNKFKKSSRVA